MNKDLIALYKRDTGKCAYEECGDIELGLYEYAGNDYVDWLECLLFVSLKKEGLI